MICDVSDERTRNGHAVPALPETTMALLQKAARAEKVDEAELADVLKAAEELIDRLDIFGHLHERVRPAP